MRRQRLFSSLGTQRKANPYMRWIGGFLLIAGAVFGVAACSPTPLQINFFFERGQTQDEDPAKTTATNIQNIQYSWPAVSPIGEFQGLKPSTTFQRNKPSNNSLPTLECPKQGQSWTGYKPLGNGLSALSPYLQVEVGMKDAQDRLIGRFPLQVACRWNQAAFFLAKPDVFTNWFLPKDPEQNNQANAALLRLIGHRVTRINDGRYLITGGVSRVTLGNNKIIQFGEFSGNTLLFDPATGSLTRILINYPKRAFHLATWSQGQVILSGGVGLIDGNPNPVVLGPEQTKVIRFVTKESPNFKELSASPDCKAIATGTPQEEYVCVQDPAPEYKSQEKTRAFQSGLFLPSAATANSTGIQTATTLQVGGLSTTVGDELKKTEELQSLFHSATYIPAAAPRPARIVVVGGFYVDKDTRINALTGTLFTATNFIYEIELDDQGKPTRTTPIQTLMTDTGQPAPGRAGHTAVAVGQKILLIGGFSGSFGNIGFDKIQDFRSKLGFNETVEILSYETDKWVAKKAPGWPVPFRRAFHTTARIPNEPGSNATSVRVLLTGGVNNLASGSSEKNDAFFAINEEGQPDTDLNVRRITGATGILHSATVLETGQILILGGGQRLAINQAQGSADLSANIEASVLFHPLAVTAPPNP